MRHHVAALALLLTAPLATSAAQVRDTTAAADTMVDYGGMPRDVARDVRDVADAPGTLRLRGDHRIGSDSTVNGDVLALDGTLVLGGSVAGRIVAVDADVHFEPGASVGGDVLVVRGALRGQADADVGGAVRVYPGGLRGIVDVVRGGAAEDLRWLRRLRDRGRRSGSEFTVTTGSTYNRVEGLPIYAGPTVQQRIGGAQTTFRAFGVVRTAHGFSLTSAGAGHLVTGEVRLGGTRGVILGGSSFDVVAPVEAWQLPDDEVGLAAFFLHRDFRDFYTRHGADARVTAFAGPDADITVSWGDERWTSAGERDPLSAIRNGQLWRPNPLVDEGRFHVGHAVARVDTRNSVENPWAGWYLAADYERSVGRVDRAGPTSDGPGVVPAGVTRYGRGFLDLRRYNRLAPDAQLNLRLVVGGWLHGDPLPLQRRLSVGGPGTIPGFDFRRTMGRTDVQTCSSAPASAPPGQPAECDRVALAQVEYRGDFGLNIDPFAALRTGPFAALGARPFAGLAGRSSAPGAQDGDDVDSPRFRSRLRSQWVVFFNAGRGWRVGERQGTLRYPSGAFPALRTFRSDVGVGLLFGAPAGFDQLGVYVAKAVSDAAEPANVVLRVHRRF